MELPGGEDRENRGIEDSAQHDLFPLDPFDSPSTELRTRLRTGARSSGLDDRLI